MEKKKTRIRTAVVSAAGRGTRMKHLTKNRPKHLLTVAGRPFLIYLLNNLRQAGIDNIIVVVGHHADQVEEFVKKLDFPVTLVNQFKAVSEQNYGSAVPIKVVESLVGTENFLAAAGDNYYHPEDIARLLNNDQFTYIGATQTDHPERMGVLVSDAEGFLSNIVEKPTDYIGNQVNASLYKFTPEIFEIVNRLKISPRGEYEITDAITALAGKRKVKVVPLHHFWMDFGRPEDIAKLEEYFKKQG